ncbi:hypothetical protein CNR22_21810 [Sphingobacteriaceae bacterium]|nr:hypothetical protein CNR22_21810 [Sphingobacteriaceae bacterium]
MSKIKISIPLIILLLLSICKTGSAQFAIDPLFYHVFDKDSLVGFDENAARASAISERFLGSEFKIRMFRLKREFINNKYNLVHTSPIMYDINTYLDNNRPAAQPGCVNEDFEASSPGVITSSTQITGWTITGGLNNPYLSTSSTSGPFSPTNSAGYSPYFPSGLPGVTSCNLLGCCPMPPAHSELIDCSAAGGYFDATIGTQYSIYSVFGTGTVSGAAAANSQITQGLFGTKVLRLNDELTSDFSLEKLSKTFAVTASNALFQFAFISVFAPGHSCCDAGGFQIRLSNASANTVIPCPNFSVSAPSSNCTGTVPVTYYNCGDGSVYDPNNNFGNIYHPWKINSMDLTSYIGQNITIDIIISDCNAGGHFGCIYFDAQCGPMMVYGNGNAYDAGLNVTVPTCGAAGATICAADGLGPYSWSGPGLTASQTFPSYTNQCITATVSAQFTLSMQPAGSCAPISRVVNSTITPAPLLNASAIQAQCGNSLAVVSITPSGSAANPSSITWSQGNLVSLNSTTTQGTYSVLPVGGPPVVVAITASDPLGCKITTTINVDAAPPTPTFALLNNTGSPSITCTYPTIDLSATTTYSYNNGSLNYFWASASATFVTNTITAINPGTYTVTGTDPVTNCKSTNLISLGINTVAPQSVINPNTQNITCNLTSVTPVTITANPTVNVTQQILAPQGGTFSSTSYTALYLPGGVGTFTYVVVNDINGCTTLKNFSVTSNQGFPSFNVSSPQNFSLGCSSKSCAIVNIVNGNTTPQGGPVSYTLLAPSSSSATQSGPLSTNSTYTVCTPGTYTVITKDNTSLCETRVPISILQNTVTPAMATSFDTQVLDCDRPRVTLKGSSTTPNVAYSWMFVGTPNTQQGDTITAYALNSTPNATTVNSYTFVIKDQSSECVSYTTIPIYQNLALPLPSISRSTPSVTCKTPTIVLTNNSASGITAYPHPQPVIAYIWNGPSPQQPLSTSTTYTGATVGIYTMTAKDLNNGCTAIATTTVFDGKLYPDLTGSKLIDTLDCGATLVKLKAVPIDPTQKYEYKWTSPPTVSVSGSDKQEFSVGSTGEYAVIVTNTINGCLRGANFAVVNGSLNADFVASTETGFAPLTVNFTNLSSSSNGSSNVNSVWNFGNSSSLTYSSVAGSSALYTQPGSYTVTLYATKGTCLASKQRVINVDIPSVLEIPNVFTPNQDGVNDLFYIKASNLTDIKAVIFDRWGKTVYELHSKSGNIEWDGKNLQGKEAAEGVYFYTIKATGKDASTYDKKGTISLFR